MGDSLAANPESKSSPILIGLSVPRLRWEPGSMDAVASSAQIGHSVDPGATSELRT
jgi:hypothetical protein